MIGIRNVDQATVSPNSATLNMNGERSDSISAQQRPVAQRSKASDPEANRSWNFPVLKILGGLGIIAICGLCGTISALYGEAHTKNEAANKQLERTIYEKDRISEGRDLLAKKTKDLGNLMGIFKKENEKLKMRLKNAENTQQLSRMASTESVSEVEPLNSKKESTGCSKAAYATGVAGTAIGAGLLATGAVLEATKDVSNGTVTQAAEENTFSLKLDQDIIAAEAICKADFCEYANKQVEDGESTTVTLEEMAIRKITFSPSTPDGRESDAGSKIVLAKTDIGVGTVKGENPVVTTRPFTMSNGETGTEVTFINVLKEDGEPLVRKFPKELNKCEIKALRNAEYDINSDDASVLDITFQKDKYIPFDLEAEQDFADEIQNTPLIITMFVLGGLALLIGISCIIGMCVKSRSQD